MQYKPRYAAVVHYYLQSNINCALTTVITSTYCRKPHWVVREFPDVVQLDVNENKCSLHLLTPFLR